MIVLICIVILIFICYVYIKRKIKRELNKYGLSSIKDIIEQARLEDEELPKSLSSMDSIYLEGIKEDFPDMNINELKSTSESIILECLNSIEKKETKNTNNSKIKAFINSEIEDLKESEISYDNIKFHNTVISKYENNNGIATITFGSSLEYYIKKDNSTKKKIQDRFKTEFIYIVDSDKVPISKKALGINCPNCGSPIKSLKDIKCEYCGTKIIELVKRVWTCNNIKRY